MVLGKSYSFANYQFPGCHPIAFITPSIYAMNGEIDTLRIARVGDEKAIEA